MPDEVAVAPQTKTPTQWATEDGIWRPISGDLSKELKPGIYELLVVMNPGGGGQIILREMNAIQMDNLIPVEGSMSQYIAELIKHFWKTEALYKKMGLIHKRGILLEGPPGCGKTATAILAAREIVKDKGVVIFVSPNTEISALGGMLKQIREIQPTVPILTVMEDIDKHHKKSIDVLLPVLDGENQIQNVFHLATTNFVEKLDARILNRPSRFDEVIKVGPPSEGARADYLKSILPDDLDPAIVKEMIESSGKLMFAHLKELAICSVVYGRPVKDTVDRLLLLAEPKAGAGFFGEDKNEKDRPRMSTYSPFLRLINIGSPMDGDEDEDNS